MDDKKFKEELRDLCQLNLLHEANEKELAVTTEGERESNEKVIESKIRGKAHILIRESKNQA